MSSRAAGNGRHDRAESQPRIEFIEEKIERIKAFAAFLRVHFHNLPSDKHPGAKALEWVADEIENDALEIQAEVIR